MNLHKSAKRLKRASLASFLILLSAAAQAQGAAIREGNMAPDFSVKMTDGTTRALSSLRGKPVMLHFWATWCPPCVRELPMIAEAAELYSGQLEVLAVSSGESLATVSSYLGRQGGALASLVSGYDDTAEVSFLYNVSAIPMTIFIDERGIVTHVRVGAFTASALDAAIKNALGN